MRIWLFVSNRASDSILGIILLRRRISLFTQDFSSLVLVLSSWTRAPLVVKPSQLPNNLPVNCNRILFREKRVFIYFNKKEIKKEELSPRKHHKTKSKKIIEIRKNLNERTRIRKFAENLRIRKFKNQSEIVPRRTNNIHQSYWKNKKNP